MCYGDQHFREMKKIQPFGCGKAIPERGIAHQQ